MQKENEKQRFIEKHNEIQKKIFKKKIKTISWAPHRRREVITPYPRFVLFKCFITSYGWLCLNIIFQTCKHITQKFKRLKQKRMLHERTFDKHTTLNDQ